VKKKSKEFSAPLTRDEHKARMVQRRVMQEARRSVLETNLRAGWPKRQIRSFGARYIPAGPHRNVEVGHR